MLIHLIMFSLSTIGRSLLVSAMTLFALNLSAEETSWPVHGEIDLSSGFCDFRAAHFHGGLDIRTGGAEGREVFSPVDGYLWRIRYSYTGFGKAVYLRDRAGFIYVFGHLSRLFDRFEKMTESQQYRLKRYSLDWEFPADSIPVKRGELVAYSGQTGAGPPHFHFEKRTPANQPLNPLTNGFPLTDKISPKIEAVSLSYRDSSSLFSNGERSTRLHVHYDRSKGNYVVDSVAYLKAAFGIELKAFDQIRQNGPKLNIYKIRFFIDNSDIPLSELQFDRYDYNETKMVDLTYDYYSAVKNKDYSYLLYKPIGQKFSGSKSDESFRGVISNHDPKFQGFHTARIEVSDAAGNMSKLVFSFVLSPGDPLFEHKIVGDSILLLNSRTNLAKSDLKSAKIYGLLPQSGWRQLVDKAIGTDTSLEIRVPLKIGKAIPKALKIETIGRSGWKATDSYIFLEDRFEHGYSLDYELQDGGIMIDATSRDSYAPLPVINAICEDSSVFEIQTQPLALSKFKVFFRSNNLTTKIIRFEIRDTLGKVRASKNCNILLAGVKSERFGPGESAGFEISLDSSAFYSPAFVELREKSVKASLSQAVSGEAYQITPEIFPLANDISVNFPKSGIDGLSRIGVGRLSEGGRWQWIKPSSVSDRITAKSGKMGTFALLADSEPPRISNLNPSNGSSISSPLPKITCNITDDLSGIDSDEQISILLDGIWLIPEYDPETTQLKTFPRQKLAKGKHQLEITVSDGAGNSREIKSTFFTKGK